MKPQADIEAIKKDLARCFGAFRFQAPADVVADVQKHVKAVIRALLDANAALTAELKIAATDFAATQEKFERCHKELDAAYERLRRVEENTGRITAEIADKLRDLRALASDSDSK